MRIEDDVADTAPDELPSHAPIPALVIALGYVLLFVLVQSVGFGLLYALGRRAVLEGELGVRTALDLGLVQLVGIAAVAALIAVGHTTWRRVGLRAPSGSFSIGWRALAPVGLLVIGPTVGYTLATGGDLISSSMDVPLALALVLLATLIAINEELWFRGIIVDRLGGAARPWFTVLASALLFGVPHATNSPASWLNAAAVTLAVGIPFAVVRLRCHSLVPLIAWHAIIDIWAFLHTASVVAQGDPTIADVAAGLFLPAIVAICYLAWMARSPSQLPRSASATGGA